MKRNNEEARITLQIIHYLKARGFAVGKIKTKGSSLKGRFLLDPTQWTGLPDLLVFIPEMIFLEVKTPTGKLSPNQKDFQQFCDKARVPYHVVRSIDDVQQIIK